MLKLPARNNLEMLLHSHLDRDYEDHDFGIRFGLKNP